MALKDLNILPIYTSNRHNVLDEFYIPVLSEAKTYKRVSAYFDANILSFYAKGIEHIVNKRGKIQFIFSSQLSEEDFLLMKEGYEKRSEILERIENSIYFEEATIEIKNLAYLIKHGFVDVKIAFIKPLGILHAKYGLVEDEEDVIYFRGSANETVAAITNNFEHFETSTSWDSDYNEQIKISKAKKEFDDLWNNRVGGDVVVVDFTEVLRDKLIHFSKDRLIVTSLPRENCYILDYEDGRMTGENRLEDKRLLSPSTAFYKREMEAYIKEFEGHKVYFEERMSYLAINRLISEMADYGARVEPSFEIYVTPNLRTYLHSKDIMLEKRRSLGIVIKNQNELVHDEFNKFSEIVSNELTRELREPQMWGSFHIAKMKRGANFSVPGAGKTSIVYGAYAYLSSKGVDEVDKIVMIGPLNSFSSWKDEFKQCFGFKRKLKVFDYQKERRGNRNENYDQIVYLSRGKNLFLFNYESLGSNLEALARIIDDRTMLVFDEVHRIKNIEGRRAGDAKQICLRANYRVVLTGTPIPNGYVDIFNMLNILFSDEYDEFFSFSEQYLIQAREDTWKQMEINGRIYPFFCRINKKDLDIPPAEPDDITTGYCVTTSKERELFRIVYQYFSDNILLLYIRLMQASTNPGLILKALDKETIDMYLHEDIVTERRIDDEDYNFIQTFDMTSKFWRGIEIVEDIFKKGPVIVWGIFIDTILKIEKILNLKGIKAKHITGHTSLENREKIISEFKEGKIEVLITNPHTLGESISLHKTCHQAVYFEYSFNLVHLLQSKDRIHRLGLEKDDKTEYYFLMLDTPGELFSPIDKKIYERLLFKEQLQSNALNSDYILVVDDDIKKDIMEVLGTR